jgi:hypothetical protein
MDAQRCGCDYAAATRVVRFTSAIDAYGNLRMCATQMIFADTWMKLQAMG